MSNTEHLDEWRDHPWWPAIEYAHSSLEELFPGYAIHQIKDKFGGLRYYWGPPNPETDYDRPEMREAEAEVTSAEFWVWGYEHARNVVH